MAKQSEAEALLIADLTAAGFPPATQVAFHELRGWEIDLAYPQIKLAIEVDGRGRHQSFTGERGDLEKINAAIEQGWRVLRYPAASVATASRRERIVEQIVRVIHGHEEPVDSACVLTGI